jgi:hypothetical protein
MKKRILLLLISVVLIVLLLDFSVALGLASVEVVKDDDGNVIINGQLDVETPGPNKTLTLTHGTDEVTLTVTVCADRTFCATIAAGTADAALFNVGDTWDWRMTPSTESGQSEVKEDNAKLTLMTADSLTVPGTMTFVVDTLSPSVDTTIFPAHLGGYTIVSTGMVGSLVVQLSDSMPGLAKVEIASLSFEWPSFSIASGTSGPNIVTLDTSCTEGCSNTGVFDLNTGEISLDYSSTISNNFGQFSDRTHVSAVYNDSTGKAVVETWGAILFPPAAPIPTLSEWGFIIVSVLLVLTMLYFIARRRTRTATT